MSLLEKFEIFKAGIVPRNCNEEMQLFFKTYPSNRQLMLLDKISKQNDIGVSFLAFLMLILGMLIGGIIVYYYLFWNFILGKPLF